MTTTTATSQIEVPQEDWIDYLTKYPDIFSGDYCGYWMRGVERDDKLGWLCWEHGDDWADYDQEPSRDAAVLAWKSGTPPPLGWHYLNEDAAVKAYVAGCQRWGIDWFDEKGDVGTYDVAIQLALLGEVRYG